MTRQPLATPVSLAALRGVEGGARRGYWFGYWFIPGVPVAVS